MRALIAIAVLAPALAAADHKSAERRARSTAEGGAESIDKPKPEAKPEAKEAKEATPDPAAVSAGDANLESNARRKGKSLTITVGGGRTIGFGIEDAVGTGGAFGLRLAQVASARTLITAEAHGVVLLHNVRKRNVMDEEVIEQARNEDTNLLVGVQFYVNRSLWIRTAAGIGLYQGRDIIVGSMPNPLDPTKTLPVFDDVRLLGPAMVVGAGFELVRFRRWSLGIEASTVGMINRDGLLSSGAVMLDATIE